MKNWVRSSLVVVVLMFPGLISGEEYKVLHGTCGNGGGVRGDGNNTVYDTAGQPVIGVAVGSDNFAEAGFWYCAGIASTVDVAITSFYGEFKDDAVVLTWSVSASAPFEGFNVYRSTGAEEAFARINAAPIPATGERSYRDETAPPGETCRYRIGAVSRDGEWSSQTISIAIAPKPTTLYQNYPNPFNPTTSIAFYLPKEQRAAIVIYDVSGARVRALVDGVMPVGRHVVRWDGRNDGGNRVASGVYYYRLKTAKDTMTKKLVVVR
jgi:hypothetical protein